MSRTRLLSSLMVVVLSNGCGEKDSDENSGDTGNGSENPTSSFLAGTLSIDSATHVYAVAPDGFAQSLVELQSDGSFKLGLESDKPYTLAVVDSNKSGAEMVVGKLSIGDLDSLAATASDDPREIQLGTLSINATSLADSEDSDSAVPEVKSSEETDAILEDMGVSKESATTLGAVDDVIGRYSNPDVDGNGTLDKNEKEEFQLDFHNRFTAVDENGDSYEMEDMKNAFLPDTNKHKICEHWNFPEFDIPDGSFTWTFSTATTLHANNCKGGAQSGEQLAANTECEVESANSNGSLEGGINVEVAPPTGTYKLTVGGTTYTWPGVQFGDLSSGKGFLALFLKFDVDSDNKLQSIGYKFMIKLEDKYELANQEALDLIVKEKSLAFSVKIDGDSDDKSFSARPDVVPEGTFHLKDLTSDAISGVDLSDVQNGIDFERVKDNPGFSYDDKLGMRYFF